MSSLCIRTTRMRKYVKLWERIFINEEVLKECKNILHIFELLLITPFSNAKLERMFSRMLRVKNDWRNRLGRDRLETLLRISEDGLSIEEFNPDVVIKAWYNDKVRRLTSEPHSYPKKRKTSAVNNPSTSCICLSSVTLSYLESEDEEDNTR